MISSPSQVLIEIKHPITMHHLITISIYVLSFLGVFYAFYPKPLNSCGLSQASVSTHEHNSGLHQLLQRKGRPCVKTLRMGRELVDEVKPNPPTIC